MAFEISEETRENNRELCKKYPFLIPHNRWTDKIPEDWNYEYTELDDMPDGWRIAFGEQFCADIQHELDKLKPETAADFRVLQIKEKFGQLRFYANWVTEGIDEVVRQYENLSERTCIRCGVPAIKITTGWISPFCDECAESYHGNTVDINDFYSKELYEE